MEQYFAQLNDDNIVLRVDVVTSAYMAENPELFTGTWVETFIGVAGKTYAGIGFTWNGTNFVAPVVEPE